MARLQFSTQEEQSIWYEALLKICVCKGFHLKLERELGKGAFARVYKT